MKKHLYTLFSFLVIISSWQVLVFYFHIEKWILPSPLQIISAFIEGRSLLLFHLMPTIFEAILGLFCAIILGIAASLLMEWSSRFKNILFPILIISQTIPFIILAPLLTIWFGFGLLPKIIIITLVCFFPITVSLFDGFSSVDQMKINLLVSMKATKMQIFKKVIIPSSLPSFFSGLRIAATYSILGAVVSEWIGAESGLGILLTRSSKSYLTDRVFAIVIIISLLSVLAIKIVDIAANLIMPWYYQKSKY